MLGMSMCADGVSARWRGPGGGSVPGLASSAPDVLPAVELRVKPLACEDRQPAASSAAVLCCPGYAVTPPKSSSVPWPTKVVVSGQFHLELPGQTSSCNKRVVSLLSKEENAATSY